MKFADSSNAVAYQKISDIEIKKKILNFSLKSIFFPPGTKIKTPSIQIGFLWCIQCGGFISMIFVSTIFLKKQILCEMVETFF